MKKIDPNDAHKLMEKETEARALWDKMESMNEDFDLIESHVKVLHGYLCWRNEVSDFGYNETSPFVEQLEKEIKALVKKVDDLNEDLRKGGHFGSYLDLDKGIFTKFKIIKQEIPTTWGARKKEQKEKKAA